MAASLNDVELDAELVAAIAAVVGFDPDPDLVWEVVEGDLTEKLGLANTSLYPADGEVIVQLVAADDVVEAAEDDTSRAKVYIVIVDDPCDDNGVNRVFQVRPTDDGDEPGDYDDGDETGDEAAQ